MFLQVKKERKSVSLNSQLKKVNCIQFSFFFFFCFNFFKPLQLNEPIWWLRSWAGYYEVSLHSNTDSYIVHSIRFP